MGNDSTVFEEGQRAQKSENAEKLSRNVAKKSGQTGGPQRPCPNPMQAMLLGP